jgi:phage-related protein
MTTTFTWQHDAKPTGTTTLRVLTAQFGDGYKQTAADGLNNKVQSWPLTFTGTSAKLTPIRDFLDARGGYQSFLWTPPLGTQALFKSATYAMRHLGGDAYEISTTFEQSFQP